MRQPNEILAVLSIAIAALLSGCGKSTPSMPAPSAITPGTLPAGSNRFVAISGKGFAPGLTVDGQSGAVHVDDAFSVGFDTTKSPEVTYEGPAALVARVPAGLGLGWHTLDVTAPDGGRGSLSNALCVSAPKTISLVEVRSANGVDPSVLVLGETPLMGGGTDQTLAPSIGTGTFDPYALAPDGKSVAYVRAAPSGKNDVAVLLVLARPWSSASEVVLDTETVPKAAAATAISTPVYSPDSKHLVYVIGGTELVTQPVPAEGGAAPEKVTLATTQAPLTLAHPNVDPTSSRVLYSEVENADANGMLLNEHHALYQVPLTGGTPAPLLDELKGGVSNGPGVYLPSGRGILFVSDRLGLEIPVTPFNAMVTASNLFVLDPATGKVTPVTAPTTMVFLSAPVVSPDGKWAAATGLLVDLTKSWVDLILTNLETGHVFRAVRDPGILCPATGSSTCPTYDLAPSFSPDAKKVYASGVAIDPLTNGVRDAWVYAVDLPATDPDLPASNRTLPASMVTRLPGIAIAPEVRETYTGCGQ